ncbi:Transcription factor and Oxoglutarate iron-dependent oxygenase domain containing protein [Trichostrongylus colubriformis]|uniref:Transcription factor and Oxoglutarate iron-dependent oxygenase domain containing protein n=1 Tax=Trichostrongylus colubriformis TaxID=6319 RepID=A0AAN8G0D0_TRICO
MLATTGGHAHLSVAKQEATRMIPSRNHTVDSVQFAPGSISVLEEVNDALRAPRRSNHSQEVVVPKGAGSAQVRAEYPVKVCPTTYASSILRGNSWTVQASSGQQIHAQYQQLPMQDKSRQSTPPVVEQPSCSTPVKTGTQYGITASIARPSGTIRGPHDQRWVDEDITHYGAIEENCDFDEWIDRVDVSKFAQDISTDLMARPKLIRKERNPPHNSAYPKPGWSYSNLIALALKNSETGQLTVSEIYAFMLEHFPYFRTAPNGWKNSVRHNLSLNKCFCKVDVDEDAPSVHQTRKSCLWKINPDRINKVEHDIRKWRERNPDSVTEGMARPEDLQAIEEGTKGLPLPSNPKQILKCIPVNKGSRRQMSYQNRTEDQYLSEDAIAAEDLVHIVKQELQSQAKEADEIVVNQNLYIPNVKCETTEDRLHCYSRPAASEEFMQTTFPSTESMLGTSNGSAVKRPRSDSFYSPSKEIPVVDLLPSAFVDAFLSLTPPKAKRVERDRSASPVGIESGFRHAHDALNDNSLLAAALEQSPYKMPVTFPVL